MTFVDRLPSATWELLPLPAEPHLGIWAWFKPQSAPLAVIFQIPLETFRAPSRKTPLTLRAVILVCGIDPRTLGGCMLYGVPYDLFQGQNPLLDFLIPEPPPGGDATIFVQTLPSTAPPRAAVMPVALPGSAASSGMSPAGITTLPAAAAAESADDVLVRMSADWNACLQLEQQLEAAAKQLNGTLARLNALNRELSPEESRFADQQDKREWQDARRWLRDASAKVSRFLKEHLVGITSAAGKRDSYDAIYKQFVQSRRPFEGLVQADREFAGYRKMLQSLLNNMTSAQGSAVQDAERRAQSIINRMAGRVRSAKSRR